MRQRRGRERIKRGGRGVKGESMVSLRKGKMRKERTEVSLKEEGESE